MNDMVKEVQNPQNLIELALQQPNFDVNALEKLFLKYFMNTLL